MREKGSHEMTWVDLRVYQRGAGEWGGERR